MAQASESEIQQISTHNSQTGKMKMIQTQSHKQNGQQHMFVDRKYIIEISEANDM